MEACIKQSGILKHDNRVFLWFFSTSTCEPQIYVKPLVGTEIMPLSDFLKHIHGHVKLYNNIQVPDLVFRSIILNINSNNERDALMSLYEMLIGARIQKLVTEFKPQTEKDVDTLLLESKEIMKNSLSYDQILELLEKEFFKECAIN